MKKEDAIKPCPFCGERMKLVGHEFPDDCYISCKVCMASGPSAPDLLGAANQWNIREEELLKSEQIN